MKKKIFHIKTKSSPAVAVKNLGKKFNDLQILNGLSFEITPGETFVLMGPSGCGKTTLLRLIAGLDQPDWGEILLGNKSASTPGYSVPPRKRSLSMVFQDLALWPHMTVRQHVDFAIDRNKYRGKRKKEKIDDLLNLVQLTNSKAYPHQLSGGEQQRLAIARALVSEPRILLLDEPLSGLDLKLKQKLLKELKNLCRHLGITILYVTHRPEEAMYLADTVAVMGHGTMESFYTVAEFIRQQQKIWEKNSLVFNRGTSRDTVIHLDSSVTS